MAAADMKSRRAHRCREQRGDENLPRSVRYQQRVDDKPDTFTWNQEPRAGRCRQAMPELADGNAQRTERPGTRDRGRASGAMTRSLAHGGEQREPRGSRRPSANASGMPNRHGCPVSSTAAWTKPGERAGDVGRMHTRAQPTRDAALPQRSSRAGATPRDDGQA